MKYPYTKNQNGAVYTATTENTLVLKITLRKEGNVYAQETFITGRSGGIFLSYTNKLFTISEFKKLAINIY